MRVSYVLWAIVFLLLAVFIFASFFRQKHRYTYDALCEKGKVCVLYPDQIEKVIATGKNLVAFFYSPECDVTKPVKPVLERYCTLNNDTVYCQINCAPKKEKGRAPDPANHAVTQGGSRKGLDHAVG